MTEEPKPANEQKPAEDQERLLKALNDNMMKLSVRLEQMNFADLVEMNQHPLKLMWNNFLAGLTRGVGMFLGAGVMGAVTLALVTWLVYHVLNQLNWIPVIGQFTHAVGEILNQFLQSHPAKK